MDSGPLSWSVLRAGLHPLRVVPLVPCRGDHRSGGRRDLGGEGHRVGLLPPDAVLPEDLELVSGALADPGHEQLPDAGRTQRAHRRACAGPVIEVTGDADAPGAGRPHRERGAGNGAAGGVIGADVRTEHIPQVLVPALADQIQVHLAERRQPPVRVVDLVHGARAVVDAHPVVTHRPVDHSGEDAAVGALERDLLALLQQGDVLRVMAQGPHDGGAVALRVCAENAVRVVRVAADQLLEVVVAGSLCGLRPGRRSGS